MTVLDKAIQDILEKSTLNELQEYLKVVDRSASWLLVSDYCFEDANKNSDTVTFSLILYHDKIENIKKYLAAFQPKDIKKSNQIGKGFLDYIISPVVYHFSFILNKDDNFFKNSLTKENIKTYFNLVLTLINKISKENPATAGYFEEFKKRINIFSEEMKAKSFNWKLTRKIMIISSLVSVIFFELTKLNKPISITWISDRDGIVEKFDGISLDISYIKYLSFILENEQIDLSFLPKIRFLTSKKDTIDDYEELVRIPDFIAGTVAELKGNDFNFRHEKYYPVFFTAIVNSKNHSIIAMDDKKNDFYIRRMAYFA